MFTILIVAVIVGITTFIVIKKAVNSEELKINTSEIGNQETSTTKIEVEIEKKPISVNLITTVDVYNADNPPQIILFKSASLTNSLSNLYNFNEEDYQTAISSNKLIILFFTSNSCQNCSDELSAIKNALSSIKHDDVVGFVVHIDDDEQNETSVELSFKYAVTAPQTKVFLRNQAKLFKISDTWSSSRYLSEIYDIIPTDITPGQ